MSIRKAVRGLGMCVGIMLSANANAIALFQFASVEPVAPEFEYHIPRVRMEADGTGGTSENSNYLPWIRSLNVILPLSAGYPNTLPLFEDFASPSTGLYLPLLGENEAFGVNIAGFINDEAGVANLVVIPDLFMQAQWQPTESSLQSAPFTPHSYSGNVARARNTASACMQARDVHESKSGLRDSDCIEAGSGESGGVANRSGNRVDSGPRSISATSARGGGTVLDGAPTGGGGAGGGGARDGRDAANPGISESGNGGGVSSPGGSNSNPGNNSAGNPSGAEGGGSTRDNENGGAGEGSGGGGVGGNEDWGSGNGDTGNWNNPGEGEGPPPSEVVTIPEPATLALLALGVAAICAVRRKQGRPVGSVD